MASNAEFFRECGEVLGRIHTQGFHSVALEPAQERTVVAANINDQVFCIELVTFGDDVAQVEEVGFEGI